MGTIIDYLKEYGDCPLTEMGFNDVDSLVLCQLSYLKFDGIVPDVRENKPAVTLEEISHHADYEKLFADVRFEKENRALFEAMLSGRRYRKLRLNCYINLVEKEWETQFSAVTCILGEGTIYIAFRGTDETIVGWKEDFNMAFLDPVPGQSYAVKYLNMVAGKLHNPIILGGHSKGGKLAVYSAMKCVPRVREHIRKIYSMDGPGFRPEVLRNCRYDLIADRVVKILPHSSLIGMIFERDIRYEVVESNTFGLAQHDPYTWKVEGRHFVKVGDVYERRKFMNDTLNEWILSLDEERLKAFVDTLYQVISAAEAENLIEFTADWKKSMNRVVAALREVDEETARMLREVVGALFDIARLRMKEEVEDKAAELFKTGKHRPRRTEVKG
ncbi:MAG: DUF2974 domain-containing protein [Lachnospiraceae bacterium]|nr:DUF2974 domain-containing protein [Lachnospiraceae bacterium]